jgi:hypothetical protein
MVRKLFLRAACRENLSLQEKEDSGKGKLGTAGLQNVRKSQNRVHIKIKRIILSIEFNHINQTWSS